MASSKAPGGVLILVENLPVPFDRRVWMEATALSEAGYEVSVVCPAGRGFEDRYEFLEGVHIYRHPLPIEAVHRAGFVLEYSIALFWEALLSLKVMVVRRVDIVHICNPPDTTFIIGLAFRLLGKKMIFDQHDLCPETYEAKYGKRGFIYWILRGLERLTFLCSTVSIAPNESYKEVAIARGRKAPAEVFVVRSAPKPERVFPVSPEPRWKRGRANLVGYVGVMGQQDGVDYLLRAAAHVVFDLNMSDTHFLLIGDGPDRPRLEELRVRLGVEDWVEFTGRISDKSLLQALSTAEVCVAPDPYCELNSLSSMNKIVEYMALGKPIVQFDLKEGRFTAGPAAIYAERNDPEELGQKIVTLLSDPERRAEMGAMGRERFESMLGWNHQVPALLSAYRATMGGRNS